MADRSGASVSGARERSNRNSTSASDRREVSETMCVPGGRGFAEFQNTRDSHASSSKSAANLAIRRQPDGGAAPAAASMGDSSDSLDSGDSGEKGSGIAQ